MRSRWAVKRWPEFAEEGQVPEESATRIQRAHRLMP